MNIVALIPARGGSKGIKNKNIKIVKGKHLIFYSIDLAKKVKVINEYFISTDSKKIKNISEKYKAKVPFLRPKIISKDQSTDLDVMKHFCSWYKKKYRKKIDLLVHLRPTTPFRKVSTIKDAINKMIKNKSYDSLRSYVESDFSGYKMWKKKHHTALPLLKNKKNYHSMSRQFIPKTYKHVGYVDILRPEKTIDKNSLIGKKVFFFELNKKKEYHMDIDVLKDLKLTQKYSFKKN